MYSYRFVMLMTFLYHMDMWDFLEDLMEKKKKRQYKVSPVMKCETDIRQARYNRKTNKSTTAPRYSRGYMGSR